MPKTQPELQVKRMEEKRIKNSMPKDTVEEMVADYEDMIKGAVLPPASWFRQCLEEIRTTAYNKGVEVGKKKTFEDILNLPMSEDDYGYTRIRVEDIGKLKREVSL